MGGISRGIPICLYPAFQEGQESQCGWLKDKFGISWQVTSPEMNDYLGGSDSAGAQRATQAMLDMRKIDLAAMKSAYENA